MELVTLLIVIWICLSIFTALHADEHGKSMAWGILVFFFGIFALPFYAISLASDNKKKVETTDHHDDTGKEIETTEYDSDERIEVETVSYGDDKKLEAETVIEIDETKLVVLQIEQAEKHRVWIQEPGDTEMSGRIA